MQLTHKSIVTLFGGLLVLGLSAAAQAQESPPPSTDPPPPPAPARHSGGSNAGGSIGVGATLALNSGLSFPVGQFVYDTSLFHIEGLFGMTSQPSAPGGDRVNEFIFGAGGWYHLHRGSSSDLSLGGVIAVDYTSAPGGSTTLTAIEPGAMVRAFLTPNVAVHARGGVAVLLGDSAPGGGANFYIGGQPLLFFGFTYFFL